MKTLYQKFAGWLWVAQHHYWLPLVWALLSFVCLCQPVFADVAGHRMIPPLLFANIIDTAAFWGCALLIVLGIVGVAWIIMGVIGVTPPPWLIKILWIIVAVVIGVLAIGFLASLGGAQPGMWFRGR